MDAEQGGNSLSKEQKIGVILLSVFSVFAIGLGILQIRNTMYAPFALNKQIPNLVRDDIVSNEALMYRDTDKDGLNDFDELYVYATSAYLADTDSDGISDKAEVDKGTNQFVRKGRAVLRPNKRRYFIKHCASSFCHLHFGPPPSPQDLERFERSGGNPQNIIDSGLDKNSDATSDADLMSMVKEF